jgi:CRISPR-associated protein Cmr2
MIAVLIVAVPGVQKFISSSRKTRDIWAASDIVSRISLSVAQAAESAGAELVFPAGDSTASVPNRVVACAENMAEAERYAVLAAAAGKAAWDEITGASHDAALAARLPIVWVAAEATTYAEAWALAQEALVRRRRVRNFPPVLERSRLNDQSAVCATCAQQRSAVTLDGDPLCRACAAKRRHRPDDGGSQSFPSTSDIASAPYRRAAIADASDDLQRVASAVELLRDLGAVVPRLSDRALPGLVAANLSTRDLGGQWLYPDNWDPTVVARSLDFSPPDLVRWNEACEAGRRASQSLAARLADRGARITPYYAIVAQDGDHMGRSLSHPTMLESLDAHRQVSRLLGDAAKRQREIVEYDGLGRVIYSGGDDLLGFVPLASLLAVLARLTSVFTGTLAPSLSGATASLGVAVVHRSEPLQDAMAAANSSLLAAKLDGRDRVCIAVLRRGGERARLVTRTADVTKLSPVLDALSGTGGSKLARRFPSKLRAAMVEAAATIPPGSLRMLPPGFVRSETERVLDRTEFRGMDPDAVLDLVTVSPEETCARFDALRVLATECA